MPFAATIVVRECPPFGFRAGFASHYPLYNGWKHIMFFGSWYGSQMSYRPFLDAMDKARRSAEILNAAQYGADDMRGY